MIEMSSQQELQLDMFVAVVFAFIIGLMIDKMRRNRRKLHRILWGMMMKRRDREKFHLMRLEDGIVNTTMEMVARGEMTEAEEAACHAYFAENCRMLGLRPGKDVKRGIQARLRIGFGLKPVRFPGPKPGEDVQVDPNYKPQEGLSRSKYAKIAG